MRWIVDAMNVIGTRPDGWWKDRHAAMARLVDQLERWTAATGDDVTVVFERAPSRTRLWAKRFLIGRMLAALRRRKRGPLHAWRSARAERSDRRAGRIPAPSPRRRDVRSVVWFPVGPGRSSALLDSIESVIA